MNQLRYIFIAVLLVALPGLAGAQSSAGEVIFEADFNNGKIPVDLIASDHWKVKKVGRDVMLHGETGNEQLGTISIIPQDELSNYAIEVTFKLVNGAFLVNGRTGANFCSAYGAAVFAVDRVIDLVSFDDQCHPTLIKEKANFDAISDDWMTLRFELSGSKLTVLVDGQPMIVADDNTYSSGFVSIYLLSNSEMDIDSVSIVGVEAEPDLLVLNSYAGDPSEAVAELIDLGLVPAGGKLLFQEDNAFFTGVGNWFTPLARRSPRTDVVMAGELSFRVGAPNEIELCSLTARIKMDGNTASTFVDVGLTNGGALVIRDVSRANADATTFDARDLRLDMGQSHHLLFILIGTELSVFVDGVLIIERAETVERAGTFGIALLSKGKDSRCQGNNIWVYDFD